MKEDQIQLFKEHLERLTKKTVIFEDKEISRQLKKQFFGVSADFERELKRVINFYQGTIATHPELKTEFNRIKRAWAAVEDTFHNTERFLNGEVAEPAAEMVAEPLEEKAASESQRKLFGMALAHKRGELDAEYVTPKVEELSKLSTETLEDFAHSIKKEETLTEDMTTADMAVPAMPLKKSK